jgi:hypothetical protein
MKSVVSVHEALFQAIERAARRFGLSRYGLYRRSLTAYQKRIRDPLITRSLNRVYGRDPHEGRLDPFHEMLQTATMPQEEW